MDNRKVVCLGKEFNTDVQRRAYYRDELRKQLPELKKIEGFPIGEDDDIINLSNPNSIVFNNHGGPDRSIQLQAFNTGQVRSRRYRNRRLGEFLKELELTEGGYGHSYYT